MRAVHFDAFGRAPYVTDAPVPQPSPGGVVVRVEATGLCRSDWHGWQGHDPDVTDLPHTPGHEFAGTVHAVGAGVQRVAVGDRVVVPFVCGCGTCQVCRAGGSHVCPRQWQPGFSGPGSFAEYVAVPAADFNVIQLPDEVSFDVAAGLGCRFATAYRAVVDVAQVREGEKVAVIGCGGVGLAAVMIASAAGGRVIAVDVDDEALELARSAGASAVINSSDRDAAQAIREIHPDGVCVSVDALGSPDTAAAAVRALRIHGRHVQVGLLPEATVGDRATVPMHLVIGRELTVRGSHGMPVQDYPRLVADVATGRLRPDLFIARTIGLEEAPAALEAMSHGTPPGVTVIRPGGHDDPPSLSGEPTTEGSIAGDYGSAPRGEANP